MVCTTSRVHLFGVLFLALGLNVLAGAAETSDLEDLRKQALELVNRDRRQHGLSRLELGENLSEAALNHARDMLRRRYYAHESLEGETAQDRYVAAGGRRWQLVAENLARCGGCEPPATEDTVERLHRGWMNSPEHRANILQRGLRRFGFGVVVGESQGLYAVQTFAGPGTPRGLLPDEEASPIDQNEQVRRALGVINRARRQAGVPPLQASAALITAADNLLPNDIGQDFSLKALSQDLFPALPDGQRRQWGSISTVAGACGGCGVAPSAADVRSFARDWLDSPQHRDTLLDAGLTHLGFALEADGDGRKVALAVLGARQ